MRHKPSKFMGKSTLDEADAWLRECEKICRVIDCTDAQKLTFVSFQQLTQNTGGQACNSSCRPGARRLPGLPSGRDFWRNIFQTVLGMRERRNSSRSSRGT